MKIGDKVDVDGKLWAALEVGYEVVLYRPPEKRKYVPKSTIKWNKTRKVYMYTKPKVR